MPKFPADLGVFSSAASRQDNHKSFGNTAAPAASRFAVALTLGFRSALRVRQDTGRLQLNVRTVVDLVLQGVQLALKFLRGLVDTSKLEHDL
jgi:hypothetical protein